ncbi:MAG TPA: ABC transporter substrate-binding protein [Chloroflexota bacterium]|nr:ABC transporter substrate-binding protein [Chloroflexota bacterium]
MRRALAVSIVPLVVAACVAGQPTDASRAVTHPSITTGPKKIVAAMMSDPPSISSEVVGAGSGTIQGGDALEDLVNAGLTEVDDKGTLRPQLSEVVPTLDNGLWRLLPDGRMETTWTLRAGAVWHDGVPFSVEDLLFTVRIAHDKDVPALRNDAVDRIERVEGLDDRTVRVTWSEPYIQADRLFTRRLVFPRPAHILAGPYDQNKLSVVQLPYWTDEYVGTGPFRLQQWVAGARLILAANDRYVLGRPKLDEIEVRFIPDSSTLAANLMAGEVAVTLGRNLSLQQAGQLRDQWKDGVVKIGIKNWFAAWPQFVNPDPVALLDLRFRRALIYALDRQQIVETLQEGLVPVADTFLSPTDPAFPSIESRIVRYPYDRDRASQLMEDLGASPGRDGTWVDATGQPIRLEVRTDGGGGDDAQETTALVVADHWKRFGIAAEPLVISQLQRRDREYNSTFPGVRVWRLPNDAWTLDRYESKSAPLPENHFNGGNRSRYMNSEFDGLVERYMRTIPEGPRTEVLGQIIHHMTDQLTVLGLYYNTEPLLVNRSLTGVTARDVGETTEAWNAHEWDVKW